MKMKRKTQVITVTAWILTLTIMFNIVQALDVKATEQIDYNNIEQRLCKNEITDIILGICSHNQSKITSRISQFSSSCYEDILKYVDDNEIESSIISELVLDYVTPSNSSTGDTVILANAKILYNNQKYNKLYMFEFHVNQEGKIYGYNVWVY